MDVCSGATLSNVTEFATDDEIFDTPMSTVCAMDDRTFATFTSSFNDTAESETGDLMSLVTAFCFMSCNYTCPEYIYSVANDPTLVKDRLSVFMPDDHYSYSFIIPFVLVIAFLLLVGILGNALAIVVIVKNRVLQASSHYLVSLAVSDVLLLVLTGPTEIAANIHFWPWNYTRILCRLRYFLIEACAFTTVLHIAAFTIERYFVVCHPMKAKSLVSASRTKKIICFIWILSFVIAFPIFFAYDLLVACEGIPESTICEVKSDAWEARVQSFYIFSSIILFFIPMFLIIALYSLIARVMFGYNVKVSMRRSASMQKRKSKGSKKLKEKEDGIEKSRRQVVKILAFIAFCFFACWCPFHVIRLMPHFGSDGWSDGFLEFYHKWLYHISILLLYTSSVVNPILYNLMSKRFRRAVWATIRCRDAKYGTSVVCETRSTSVNGATSV
ncbi:Growth hormone secretagogue receptor type 1 [Holothuria leucospilota]|uniref:Growth hormone secretagogue receptor type 1 n=1 Tax=Holothuria leucospilota TaxID=206669 RepID=A0A9Q0YGZ7_HOLLE|nr:Growth hormone secretagogue receptor type 1 [Holothuria leucospilota]